MYIYMHMYVYMYAYTFFNPTRERIGDSGS